jgi:hypothetical protein
MRYPLVNLMEKPGHQPGNYPLPMAQESQNGTRDADTADLMPMTPDKDENVVHH